MKRRILDWVIVLLALAFNIIWYFVPLAGETGFASLWVGAHPIVAVLVSLVPTGFFIGRLILSIKRW